MACLGIAFMGAFFIGVREMGMWIGAGQIPVPAVPPVAASWVICGIGLTLIGVQRLRKMPLSPYSHPFVIFPIADRRLIGSVETSLLVFALPLALVSLGALPVVAMNYEHPLWESARYLLATIAASFTGWLMTEALAKYIPVTRMLSSCIIIALIGVLTLLMTLSVVPRSYNEITHEQLYGPLLFLPPGGFYIGLTNLVQPSLLRTVFMPLSGLLATYLCWRIYIGTLELRDIRLLPNARASASRAGWLSSWNPPVLPGQLSLIEDRAKAIEVVSNHLKRAMRRDEGSRNWLMSVLMPIQLSSKQLCCMGLLGMRFPRGKGLSELLGGFFPIPVAAGLLVFNQFYPLAGIPGFLKFPLILSFALAALDLREISASMLKGEQQLGFTLARSVFPFSYWDILKTLMTNRLIMLLSALPGWTIAIAMLYFTDIPKSFLLNIPAVIVVLNFLVPLLSAATYSTSNLRSSWKAWTLCVIPWSILVGLFFMGLQIGVFGYFMAMRIDLAWFWLLIGAATLGLASTLLGYALSKGMFDENTTPLNHILKQR